MSQCLAAEHRRFTHLECIPWHTLPTAVVQVLDSSVHAASRARRHKQLHLHVMPHVCPCHELDGLIEALAGLTVLRWQPRFLIKSFNRHIRRRIDSTARAVHAAQPQVLSMRPHVRRVAVLTRATRRTRADPWCHQASRFTAGRLSRRSPTRLGNHGSLSYR